jgi:hypothetical protein
MKIRSVSTGNGNKSPEGGIVSASETSFIPQQKHHKSRLLNIMSSQPNPHSFFAEYLLKIHFNIILFLTPYLPTVFLVSFSIFVSSAY